MPPKIRKKSETAGLKQPDQVMTKLQTTYVFLDKFKYHIVGGFFGVVVILLGISWFMEYRKDRRQDMAQAFFDAFKYFDAPVGTEAPPPEGMESFPTAEAKFTKLGEELTAFLEEHSSEDISDTARLVLASTKMELGDYEGAHALLTQVLENKPDTSLAPIVLENVGYACIHLGKAEEAVSHFERMKESSSNPYVMARALVHLGDLRNPGATGAPVEKDREKALEFYQQALELLPEQEEEAGEAGDPAMALTRQEIETRISLLKLG